MLEIITGTLAGFISRGAPGAISAIFSEYKANQQAKRDAIAHERELAILKFEVESKRQITQLNNERDMQISIDDLVGETYTASTNRYERTNQGLVEFGTAKRQNGKTGFWGARFVFYARASVVPFLAFISFLGTLFLAYYTENYENAEVVLGFAAGTTVQYFLYKDGRSE